MRKLILFLFISICAFCMNTSGQSLPQGECGILFTYDATGSLIKREYVCNNSGRLMSPEIMQALTETKEAEEQSLNEKEEIIGVNTIMPNPTTGRFTVRFAKPVDNVQVTLVNANGSIIEKKKVSGNRSNFNLSNQASGVYFIHIEDGPNIFTFKVVKL